MRYFITLNGMSSPTDSEGHETGPEVNVLTVHGAGDTPQAALSDALAFAGDALTADAEKPQEPS